MVYMIILIIIAWYIHYLELAFFQRNVECKMYPSKHKFCYVLSVISSVSCMACTRFGAVIQIIICIH